MSKLYLNLLAIILLVVIVIGILLMPRSNYDAITIQQEQLRRNNTTLSEEIGERIATLESLITMVPTATADVRDILTRYSEFESATKHRIEDIEGRLSALETVANKARPSADNGSQYATVTAFFTERYTEPIELPEPLRSTVDSSPAAEVFEQERFDNFLRRMIELEVLPFGSVSELPEELVMELRVAFDVFAANIRAISREETIDTEELVSKANELGTYFQTEFSTQAKDQFRGSPGYDERPGITCMRKVANDRSAVRYYHFVYDDNPQLLIHGEHRNNAKAHLFRDVHVIGKRFQP